MEQVLLSALVCPLLCVIPPLFLTHFLSGAGAVGNGAKGLSLAPNYVHKV